ncbi:TadE/TadG family type IV pilus assembly protein [Ornithinimicrobium sp. W1679]|uniref:TadE/TadG family type IV pilus assembly protein n=1 Tax=Ornithinimicrobium sp. W1679 TaxID=3418770 RepID=UPI003CF6DA1F
MTPGTSTRGQRGSISVEMVVLGPVLLLFVLAVLFAGRYALAQQAVQAAAAEAARAASIARSAEQASGAATGAASASLSNQDVRCATASVSVDTAAFASRPGTPGVVTASVSCQVDMSDLAFPGIPGNRTVEATMSSPVDTYRGRNG